ncbi:CotH kinase family protein [Cytobacillus sp. IB215665]|uniref:CotH kinase family protein n=1 Tax=Cytobacillus sp. IB215665 TaxID=3097357 RepID=UPI002A0F139C|nr:CotH kinase family protein [Cytobacillus sp. IB215665]MDX8366092.1 CotH kinase family protein [Cytobacillus sp. IB215665]
MISNKFIVIIYSIATIFVVASCSNDSINEAQTKENTQEVVISSGISEDNRLYDFYERDSVVTLYVTILGDNQSNDPVSFYELNNWYSIYNSQTESPKLDIIIQEGNDDGPINGSFNHTGTSDANASISIRGKSTRIAPQKSYKINLHDRAGLWRGQKTLNLNKHPYDPTRVRNKLSFDYFTEIANLTSVRTQFVQLYVKDLTSGRTNEQFEDYGLFTHVEQVNERFLASHGLDPNGNLYKASNFEFYRYPEQLRLESDPLFDKGQFESILENKGSKDHQQLLDMLDDVNNKTLNINDVVNEHFDKENYLTWVAANILVGNTDIMTQNYYLYSPINSKKWYFLPWDYDGAWREPIEEGEVRQYPEWHTGLSNYWGSVLHNRFFKDPTNVDALTKKIEELSQTINPNQTRKMLDEYYNTVYKFVNSAPDLSYLRVNIANFDDSYYSMVNVTEQNMKSYFTNLEKPMPFFLGVTHEGNGSYLLTWDPSYDVQGDDISYVVQVSRDPSFLDIVYEKKDMIDTKSSIDQLDPGQYFLRVTAIDSKGNVQYAFDQYEDSDGVKYFGILAFHVQ